MPKLRRKAKARLEALTEGMLTELAHGIHGGLDHEEPTYPGGSVFESAISRRAAWIQFRELVEAEVRPLERADAWWEFESKVKWWEMELENEWPISSETLALEKMGELSPTELALLEATRRTRDEKAAERERSLAEYEAERRLLKFPEAVQA